MENIFNRETPRTLNEIVDSIIENEAIICAADGEISPELEPYLAQDSAALAAKIDGYSDIIRDSEARAKALGEEIKRLQALKKTCENKAAGLKDFLRFNMSRLGTTRLDGTRCKAYFSSATVVEAFEDAILKPYMKAFDRLAAKLPAWVQLEIKVAKKPLGDALKTGTTVKGASLQKRDTLVLK